MKKIISLLAATAIATSSIAPAYSAVVAKSGKTYKDQLEYWMENPDSYYGLKVQEWMRGDKRALVLNGSHIFGNLLPVGMPIPSISDLKKLSEVAKEGGSTLVAINYSKDNGITLASDSQEFVVKAPKVVCEVAYQAGIDCSKLFGYIMEGSGLSKEEIYNNLMNSTAYIKELAVATEMLQDNSAVIKVLKEQLPAKVTLTHNVPESGMVEGESYTFNAVKDGEVIQSHSITMPETNVSLSHNVPASGLTEGGSYTFRAMKNGQIVESQTFTMPVDADVAVWENENNITGFTISNAGNLNGKWGFQVNNDNTLLRVIHPGGALTGTNNGIPNGITYDQYDISGGVNASQINAAIDELDHSKVRYTDAQLTKLNALTDEVAVIKQSIIAAAENAYEDGYNTAANAYVSSLNAYGSAMGVTDFTATTAMNIDTAVSKMLSKVEGKGYWRGLDAAAAAINKKINSVSWTGVSYIAGFQPIQVGQFLNSVYDSGYLAGAAQAVNGVVSSIAVTQGTLTNNGTAGAGTYTIQARNSVNGDVENFTFTVNSGNSISFTYGNSATMSENIATAKADSNSNYDTSSGNTRADASYDTTGWSNHANGRITFHGLNGHSIQIFGNAASQIDVGIVEAYNTGFDDGYDSGYTDGYNDGYADGFADGRAH